MDLLLKDLHLVGALDSLAEHAKSLRRHFPDPAMEIIDSMKHTTYFTVKLQGLIPPIEDDIINKLLRIWFHLNESFPPQKILICLH